MNETQVNIQLSKGEIPKIVFLEYSDFNTFDLIVEKTKYYFFLQGDREVIAIKNAVLWAFEKWEREQKKLR